MNYRKYTWIGNKISSEDMAKLHQIKLQTGRKITEQVAEAIREYLQNRLGCVKMSEPIP